MALYLISYDLHRVRNYDRFYDLMDRWAGERLLDSVWLAELRGPAAAVLDLVAGTFDGDDGIAVIELEPTAEWATLRAQDRGVDWLFAHIPSHDRPV